MLVGAVSPVKLKLATKDGVVPFVVVPFISVLGRDADAYPVVASSLSFPIQLASARCTRSSAVRSRISIRLRPRRSIPDS